MNQSTCLHIQDCESGPIRVVELPWIFVRIGRAAHCEVRLAQCDLPDEICRLQRRGRFWRLLPVAAFGPITLAGRILVGSCLLPFDVPFRIAQLCFTLRRDSAAAPDWEMYTGHARRQLDLSQTQTISEEALDVLQSRINCLTAENINRTALMRCLLEEGRSDVSSFDREQSQSVSSKTRADVVAFTARTPIVMAQTDTGKSADPTQSDDFSLEGCRDRWETRWKALGAQIKARAISNRNARELRHANFQWEFKTVPLRKSRVPVIQPPLLSAVGQPATLVPMPRLVKVKASVDSNAEPLQRERVVDLSEGVIPTEQFWQDRIARDLPLQSSLIPREHDVDHKRASQLDKHWLREILVEIAPLEVTSVEDAPIEVSQFEIDPVEDTIASPIVTQQQDSQSMPPVVSPDAMVHDGRPEMWNSEVEYWVSQSCKNDTSEGDLSVRNARPRQTKTTRRRQRTKTSAKQFGEGNSLVNNRHATSLAKSVEWPSAKHILATHCAASSNRVPDISRKRKPATKSRSYGTPTLARAPVYWTPPVRLVGPTAVVLVGTIGLLGCVLSWFWASDAFANSILMDRLLTSDRVIERGLLPKPTMPNEGGWMISTAGQLAHRAIFLSQFSGEGEQSRKDTIALLERALKISPINATARLALAELEAVQDTRIVSLRSLGLSRDSVSLAWTARRLLAAGEREDALKLYSRALSVATQSEWFQSSIPRFSEDRGVPRYLLPGEEHIRDIVVDLVSQDAWSFREWWSVLPKNPSVLIATARLLRERGRFEAEAVLEQILKDSETDGKPEQVSPIALAARAEASALGLHWREADQLYRQAIHSVNNTTIARSWWFNLADIYNRSGDEAKRQAALRAASSVACGDDITRHASEIQRATLARLNGVRAN